MRPPTPPRPAPLSTIARRRQNPPRLRTRRARRLLRRPQRIYRRAAMIAEAKDQIHCGAPPHDRAGRRLAGRSTKPPTSPPRRGARRRAQHVVIVAVAPHAGGQDARRDAAAAAACRRCTSATRRTQLAAAVAGEPAGSMALHALGKLDSQLGRIEPQHPQADRRAFALQQAALLARDDNHLAAHELGVLLAESGHYVEAINCSPGGGAARRIRWCFATWPACSDNSAARRWRRRASGHSRAISPRAARRRSGVSGCRPTRLPDAMRVAPPALTAAQRHGRPRPARCGEEPLHMRPTLSPDAR